MVNKVAYLTAGNRTAVKSEQHHKVPSHIHRISSAWNLLGSKFHSPLNQDASCETTHQVSLLHRCFYTMAVTTYIQVNTYFKGFELKIIASRIQINIFTENVSLPAPQNGEVKSLVSLCV